MRLLSRRTVAAATFALLPLTALAVPGTATAEHCTPGAAGCEDNHAPTVHSTTVSRPIAVVFKRSATPVTITVRVSDPSGVSGVSGLVTLDSATDFPVGMKRVSKDENGIETWSGTFTPSLKTPTGLWSVGAEVVDSQDNDTVGPQVPLYIKRNTGLAMNASPEPVAKGGKLLVVGKLTRLTAAGNYVAYRGKQVDLFFRPVGGKYAYVGSDITDRDGRFGGFTRATQDGTWQVRFKGTSNYVAKKRGDYVDVR